MRFQLAHRESRRGHRWSCGAVRWGTCASGWSLARGTASERLRPRMAANPADEVRQRRGWDLNPRRSRNPETVFETSGAGHERPAQRDFHRFVGSRVGESDVSGRCRCGLGPHRGAQSWSADTRPPSRGSGPETTRPGVPAPGRFLRTSELCSQRTPSPDRPPAARSAPPTTRARDRRRLRRRGRDPRERALRSRRRRTSRCPRRVRPQRPSSRERAELVRRRPARPRPLALTRRGAPGRPRRAHGRLKVDRVARAPRRGRGVRGTSRPDAPPKPDRQAPSPGWTHYGDATTRSAGTEGRRRSLPPRRRSQTAKASSPMTDGTTTMTRKTVS